VLFVTGTACITQGYGVNVDTPLPAALLTAVSTRSAGCVLFAFYPGLDNIGGTADPGGYRDGFRRAVQGAGAALHAAIAVYKLHFWTVHFKNTMGANGFTGTASHALFRVKNQGGYIRQMSESFHRKTSFL
jgi:hypothetical protein